MGYSAYVYVGAYLEVKKCKRKENKKFYLHHETDRRVKSPFDPHTGIANVVKEETIVVDYEPCISDVGGNFDDIIYSPEFCNTKLGYKTFIPQIKGPFSITTLDTDYGESVELYSIDINSHKEVFKEKFNEVIEGFKKLSDDVKVKFGIITYHS